MIELSPWLRALLALFSLAAGVTDWRRRLIPNYITIPALAAGFLLQTAQHGLAGLKDASLGMAAAAAITIPLYLLRGLGGGDVKMMAAAGAIAGPLNFLYLFVLNAVIGGVGAVALVLYKGRLVATLRNMAVIFRELAMLRAPYQSREELAIAHPEAITLPRGVVFAAAAGLLLLL